jgi:ectoine hydroxylase-related dioxygenase (phytanoyl-CoA dioxygenase family)
MIAPMAVRVLSTTERDAAVAAFATDGYAVLPGLLAADDAAALANRAEAIMTGAVDPAPFFFQHDAATGRYEDLTYGHGFIGPSRAYRKLEHLERDPAFHAWLAHPALAPLVEAILGAAAITLYRAVLWNKIERGGTELPWHQDGGRFWGVAPAPILQLWTALDDAPAEAGCVEVIAGSHRGGLATPEGGTIPDGLVAPLGHLARPLPARRGDVLLLHNHLWHRSRRNATGTPRRALSACYMPATTRCTRTRGRPRTFVRMF